MKGFYGLFVLAAWCLGLIGGVVYAVIGGNYVCAFGSLITALMALPYVKKHIVV